MRSERNGAPAVIARWIGVALTLLAVVSILWLAATGRLELYVHPRYTVFTVVFALVGGALGVAAILLARRGDDDGHDHGHTERADLTDVDAERADDTHLPEARPSRWRVPLTVARVAIVVLSAVALIVLPPAALTAHTAQNRSPAGPESGALASATAPLVGGSTASFTVKDWAALLRGGDSDALAGRTARITAYVLPIEGADDEFYAARLLVTCCAVDAQPVAVPVHVADWRSRYSPNGWVEITGRFQQNPDASSAIPTVLVPERIRKVSEPAKPYVY